MKCAPCSSSSPSQRPHGLTSALPGLASSVFLPRRYNGVAGLRGSLGNPILNKACVITHCYRSISKRALVFTRNICSGARNFVTGTGAVTADLLTGMGFGSPVVGEGQGITIYDSNAERERGQVENMVLVALRVNCCVGITDLAVTETIPGGPTSVNVTTDFNGQQEALCCAILTQTGLRIFNSNDTKDPWVDFTNLLYFAGPDFVPVPPLKYVDRDQRIFFEAREPFYPAGLGTVCPIIFGGNTFAASMVLSFQAIFLPDPRLCGDDWPGRLCPEDMIIGCEKPTRWYYQALNRTDEQAR